MTVEPLSPERVTQAWSFVWHRAQQWQDRSDTQDAWDHVAGSHLAGDDRLSSPLQVSHASQTMLHAAIDHQHAACHLVMEGRVLHTYAGATLVRAALESACSVIWLLEPSSRMERLTRSLRWNTADLTDSENIRKTMGRDSTSRKARVEARIAPVAARAKVDLKEAMRPIRSTAIVTAADTYVAALGDPAGLLANWQLCSGFAHGRRWSSLAFAEREERDSTLDPGSVNVRFSMTEERMLGLVLASDSAIERAIELYERRGAPIRPPAKSKRRK